MADLFTKPPLDSLNILAVDDEIFNLEILTEWLSDRGIHVTTAENGRHALEVLQDSTGRFDAILLDRMMPEMDGLECLAAIKALPQWKDVPVIMQSAAATVEEVQTALDAGIWYYLSKPFERRKLFVMIETAVGDYRLQRRLRQLVEESPLEYGNDPVTEIQTVEQAQHAAVNLAKLSDNPGKIVIGLFELLLNAIEHGNLAIGYQEKTRLLNEQRWLEEIESRLCRTPYSDHVARVSVSEVNNGVQYLIQDQGRGFKSKPYLQLQTHRAADNHGRGISFANRLSFADLLYQGTGNQVCALATKVVA
ncbi:MAG: response regulator [Gammaproteobacteria bacterium]|jgi:CheY-like chemotaxis protein|nr:response regulator [Gammaproteobacteria bacterium]